MRCQAPGLLTPLEETAWGTQGRRGTKQGNRKRWLRGGRSLPSARSGHVAWHSRGGRERSCRCPERNRERFRRNQNSRAFPLRTINFRFAAASGTRKARSGPHPQVQPSSHQDSSPASRQKSTKARSRRPRNLPPAPTEIELNPPTQTPPKPQPPQTHPPPTPPPPPHNPHY